MLDNVHKKYAFYFTKKFRKKIKRDTVTFDEMILIADTLGIVYEQTFVLKDGRKIQIGNTEE